MASPLRQTKFALVLLVAIVVLTISTPLAFANSHCHPLLVMIEGGGRSTSSGKSIRALTNDIEDEYRSRGITIAVVDNGIYWSRFWKIMRWEPVKETAQGIKSSNYWPVVIVGHSLGAAIAWELARLIPISLLVTLDGVSFKDDVPLEDKNWRNVWVDKNAWGPDWGPEPADIDYSIGDFTHYDVKRMWTHRHPKFGSAGEAVLRALTKCPNVTHVSSPKPEELCKLNSVGCRQSWR